jgi:SnoaL-like domain
VAEHESAPAVRPLSADDRAAIDDLLATYALSLDVDDIDTAVNLFVENGEFRMYGRALTGRDRLRRMFQEAPGACTWPAAA